eukprot:15133222-Heterocapsa_arctica.AAC.1
MDAPCCSVPVELGVERPRGSWQSPSGRPGQSPLHPPVAVDLGEGPAGRRTRADHQGEVSPRRRACCPWSCPCGPRSPRR